MKKHFIVGKTIKRFLRIGTSLALSISTLSLFPSEPRQSSAADTMP